MDLLAGGVETFGKSRAEGLIPTVAVYEDLTDEEAYLYALLQDASGVDIAEFLWIDETSEDFVYRCWDFQIPWGRSKEKFQVDQCVAEGSMVLTARGQVPIERVAVGDLVLTHRGRWRPVTSVWDKGEQDTLRITGNGLWSGLQVTPEHELYTRLLRRKTALDAPQWTRADQLRVHPDRHDKWATPAVFERLDPPKIIDRYAPGTRNDLTLAHLDREDFWWLAGLYAAEGSTSSSYGRGGKRNRTAFSVHVDEEERVTSTLDRLGFRCSVSATRSEMCVNVVVNSLTLATYMTDLCGSRARTKRLHPSIFSHPLRAAFLDGASSGDGHSRNGAIEYKTTSRALALDMRLLASSLGFASSVSRHARRPDGEICGRVIRGGEFYTVGIVMAERQKTRAVFDGDHVWARPTKVEAAGRARCYDLEVAGDHSFIAEGVVVHNCGRALGKSEGMQMRAFAFPFVHPGEEMLLTAPEMIHLDPVTERVERRLLDSRVTREMLKQGNNSKGIRHRPFVAEFVNGSKIIGRIPQKDGRGVKGMHPKILEMDEGQDYPAAGWVELGETLKFGNEESTWRVHGVSNGVHDRYYKATQDPKWAVHRYTAQFRPDWTDEERESKMEFYGSRHNADYRRNIMGQHGDLSSPIFVLHRLMAVTDTNSVSPYNTLEYYRKTINDNHLQDSGLPIELLLDMPESHRSYARTWIGFDVGLTNHPSEALVFGEHSDGRLGGRRKSKTDAPLMRLKLLSRITLRQISSRNQRRLLGALNEFYRPQTICMDNTGLGKSMWQEIVEEPEDKSLAAVIRGYDFASKIIIGWDSSGDKDGYHPHDPERNAIYAPVLEYSTDALRRLVDEGMLLLPNDAELIREFSGQTYTVSRSATAQNPYGKKIFSRGGGFHALDAARMAVLGWQQQEVDLMTLLQDAGEPIYDYFLSDI